MDFDIRKEYKKKVVMAQMEVTYVGTLRTEGVHLQSGTTLITDAPVDNNGKGEKYSPTDLVCTALASCMMTIMGIQSNKHGWDIEGLHAKVTKVMAVSPRKIAAIKIEMTLGADKIEKLDEAAIKILKDAAYTCPVALSLDSKIRQEVEFNF